MSYIDFGNTAEDYSRYRAGFPPKLYDRLKFYDVGLRGQYILDIGTGTGVMARVFTQQGCKVIGMDPSSKLMERGKLADASTSGRVFYVRGYAEQTGLASDAFDVVTAGQCWHWFDRPAAAQEMHRVLRPGGALVIAHFDWVALPRNVVSETIRLIQDYNPTWKPKDHQLEQANGMYPAWLFDVANAGYTDIETFSFDVEVRYTHESWRGRIRASAGVAASMPPSIVVQFDSALQNLLMTRFQTETLNVPHRVWALICRT